LGKIIKMQNTFPLGVTPRILVLILFGLLLAYLGVICIVVSLFNLVVFLIFIVLILNYLKWAK
jgi:hypothetical protein